MSTHRLGSLIVASSTARTTTKAGVLLLAALTLGASTVAPIPDKPGLGEMFAERAGPALPLEAMAAACAEDGATDDSLDCPEWIYGGSSDDDGITVYACRLRSQYDVTSSGGITFTFLFFSFGNGVTITETWCEYADECGGRQTAVEARRRA